MSNTRTHQKNNGDAQHAAHGIDNPAVEAGMSRDVINIGLHIFRTGIRRYTDEEQELLEWLWGYTFDVLGNSKIELQRALGYEWPFVYGVFTGSYDGEMGAFCNAIRELRQRADEKMPLVKTVVTERIIAALDYARDWSAMVTITGPTGRGKSYTAQYWARMNNHGRTRFIRVPCGCSRRQLATELAQKSGIGSAGVKKDILERRLFSAFTARNVIIVDEAGFLLPRSGRADALELLRDLHDKCGCAIAMIFTDVYLKEINNGPMADYFEQFRGRIKYGVPIPNRIFRGEVEAAVKAFTKEPSRSLIEYAYTTTQARDGKLRTLYEDLRRAKDFAMQQNRQLALGDLKAAVEWRKSGGVWPEE